VPVRALSLSLIGGLLAAGRACGPAGPLELAEPPLFPLEVEREAVYEYHAMLDGGEGSHTFRLVGRGRKFVAGLNRVVFVVDEISPDGVSPTGYFFEDDFLVKVVGLQYQGDRLSVNPGGSLLKGGENLQRMLPRTRIRPGARWEDDGHILNSRVKTRNHVSGIESTDCPAGHFDRVYRIDSEMTIEADPRFTGGDSKPATYLFAEWYAAGVGLVKSRVTSGSGMPAAEVLLKEIRKQPAAKQLKRARPALREAAEDGWF
jgi:hypothetical protein